ncbi:MAG: hypothetical protein ABI400_05860, partial [Lacisediminihabitans sp.]
MLARIRSIVLRSRGRHAARTPLRAPASIAAALCIALIGGLTVAAPAAYAAELGTGVLNLSKTATVTTATAGQQFTYTINFGCSSTTTGCVDAVLTDPVPAPLTIVGTPAVVGAGTVSTSVTGNTVKVAFGDSVPNTTPASTGLAAGTTGSVQVQVKVPDSVAKSFDGTALNNTATFVATNAATVTAAVPVTLSVPDITKATLSKTWTPASTQYEPGAQSTATLTVKNDSNVAATSLSIDEPIDPSAAASTFNFFDFDGFGAVVFPAGADRVQVIATGTGAAVPGAVGVTPVLPASVNAADVTALTFVFTSSTGNTISAVGSAGSVEVKLAQRTTNRSDATPLVNSGTRTNTIGGAVVTAANTSAATPVSAQQVIAPLTVTVSAGKSFSTSQLPAGESTNATLTATNTSTGPLTSLTVREPSSGTFFTSDVSFAGFNNASSQWPSGADAATVKWFVSTGTAPADSSATSASGLPATPTLTGGQYLTGFEVTYTGTIDTGSVAKINFTVDTAAGAGPVGSGFTRYPNAISVIGANSAGSNTATANANLDVYFPEIALTLDKTITPKTVVPGGTSLVQLSAQTPSGTSSVRPKTIVITEPVAGTGAQYWDAFDATAIAQTSVPLGSILTIEYTTDGSTWQTLTSVDATAAAKTYNGVLDDVLPQGTTHSNVEGLRFTFTDNDGFGQATNVKPGIVFVARGTLRGTATPTNPGDYPALTTYTNCANTNASGTVDGGTVINSALVNDCETANVQATNGGPGPIIAAKSWDGTKVLQAQSGATTGVTLDWGTVTTGIQSMSVQDPAVEAPISSSVFQAFDLVRIDAITPTNVNGATFDPLMRWDSVSMVELYNGTSWQDITAQACPTTSSCAGIFPGYSLTPAQRASTQGVRLTMVENPNRAAAIAASTDPTAPPVGSGVASASAGSFPGASADGRTMHLDLKLRNAVRGSTVTDWVTGTQGTREYNVAGSPGVVNNTMNVHGVPFTGAAFDRTAQDHVTIIDPTLTTKVTKTASPTTLIIPQPDVAASDYPSTVYTTTIENTSTTNTWQLRLTDPVTCSNATSSAPCDFGAYDAASNPFDQLNLTGIAIDLSHASGVESSLSTVSLLRRAADGTLTTDTVSLTQATLIAPAQLADVVGVSAVLQGTNAQGGDGTGGTIASGQKATIALTTQLRTTSRSAGAKPTVGNM